MASLVRTEATRSGLAYAEDEAREFLVMLLGGELYGVELARVKEIVVTPKLARVPRAAADVLGICTVRGLLVTVVDLRLRLRLAGAPLMRPTRVLLTHRASGEVIGLLVDSVRNVVKLTRAEIEPTSSALGSEGPSSILGVGRSRGEMLVLLNLATLVE